MGARIQVADVVMKYTRSCWAVGISKPRVIKGRPTEEIIRPSYVSDPSMGIPYFVGRVHNESDGDLSGEERALLDALCNARMDRLLPVFSAPDVIARDARGDLSMREFARRAGVPYSTLWDVEHGADARCSTLTAILLAAQGEEATP